MAIDRTGTGADAPRRGRSAAEDGRRRLSCLARNAGGRSPQAGEESRRRPLRSRRPRRSRPPSRLAHQRTLPERPDRTGQDGDAASTLWRPPPQRGRRSSAPTPPRAHPGPPSPAQDGPRQALLTSPAAGRTIRSRLPAWTGRCAKDSTRERAPLGQAPHRISPAHPPRPRRGRPPGRITRAGQPNRGAHLEAGRADPRSRRRRERSEAIHREGGIQWMPAIWAARLCRSGSKTVGRICPRWASTG